MLVNVGMQCSITRKHNSPNDLIIHAHSGTISMCVYVVCFDEDFTDFRREHSAAIFQNKRPQCSKMFERQTARVSKNVVENKALVKYNTTCVLLFAVSSCEMCSVPTYWIHFQHHAAHTHDTAGTDGHHAHRVVQVLHVKYGSIRLSKRE